MSEAMTDLPAPMALLDLRPGETPNDYTMSVTPRLSTPFEFLYGGSGIAASAEASERTTGRPLQWITTQFLGSPGPGDVVQLHVNVAVEGRMTTQTQVSGTVRGALMFTSLCAHNVRPDALAEEFSTMPAVPPPDECPEFGEPFEHGAEDSFFGHLTRRVAAGTIRFADDHEPEVQRGTVAMWCRLDDEETGSPATQGFLADVGPLAVCARLGLPLGGTSLDNTLRIVDTAPSDWVLLELDADGLSRSIGHSTTRVWSRDGRLLGIAQQSALIRTSHHRR